MAIKSLRLNLDKLPPADPDSSTVSPQFPPLLRLPVELHLEIVSYIYPDNWCRVFDRLALHLTNRFYYGLFHLDLDQLRRLKTLERRNHYGLYACEYCLCLRRADKFADDMLKGRNREDYGGNGYWLEPRWCADCGFDERNPVRYSRGVHIMVNGIPWLHCIVCDKVKRGAEVGKTARKELCKDCHARYGCLYVKDHPKHHCKFNPQFYSAKK